jgi:hypothetical protein
LLYFRLHYENPLRVTCPVHLILLTKRRKKLNERERKKIREAMSENANK